MLRHNILIIYRHWKHHKGTFLINLIGLSTGLACSILIYLWVSDELSVDKFNENDSRIFQVMKNAEEPGGGIDTYEWTPGPLAQALAAEMPEVELAVTSLIPEDTQVGILSVGDTKIKAIEQYVSRDYFNIFSYQLIQGDKQQVLSKKNEVLISDELALKLFHTKENIIGKSVEWDKEAFTGTYLVSGVFKKSPSNATAQFDLLFTFDLYREINPDIDDWKNAHPNTYVLLKEGTRIDQFNEKIGSLLQSKTGEDYQYLFIRPYSDKYLYGKYENGVQSGGRIAYVRLFSIVALLILVLACINFMNLSTAKAAKRIKEVGVKKVLGAGWKTLVFQYLGESMLMTTISLMVAVLGVLILLPQFNAVTGKHLTLEFDSKLILSVGLVTLFTGLISGSYPALYLSRFNPITVLKGSLNTSFGEMWSRKGLVIFQFTISVILVVSVLVVYHQIVFIQSKNLGFNKDNIIIFKKEGSLHKRVSTFLREVKSIPGVVNASSFSQSLTGINDTGTEGVVWEGKEADDHMAFKYLMVNQGFIETLGIEIKEGRPFSENFVIEASKIIFNEAAIEGMGLKHPIGKIVNHWGTDKQIVAVVKDFHFESLYEPIKPCFFMMYQDGENIMVKITAGREKETIAGLEKLYQQYNPSLPFDYKFLDDNYQALYAAEQRVTTLSKYFAGIAILISCLGIFGLAAFTAERRLKEIGIRKILGSSVFGIVRLLSSDFTKMVVTAIVIALPVSYFFAKNWLNDFAYHIELQWWYFAVAGLLALVIAWFTVGVQTINAARINPVDSLKDE